MNQIKQSETKTITNFKKRLHQLVHVLYGGHPLVDFIVLKRSAGLWFDPIGNDPDGLQMKSKNDRTLVEAYARLWSFLSLSRRNQAAVTLLLMVAASMLEAFSIGAILPFIGIFVAPETLFNHHIFSQLGAFQNDFDTETLRFYLAAIFATLVFLSTAVRILLQYSTIRLGHAIAHDVTAELFKQTVTKPFSAHLNTNSSEIISSATMKANSIAYQSVIPVLNLINSVVLVTAIMALVLAIEFKLSLMAGGSLLVVYGLITFLLKNFIGTRSGIVSAQQNLLIQTLQETMGSIRNVIIDKTQEFFASRLHQASFSMRRALAQIEFVGGTPRYLVEMTMILVVVTALVVVSLDGLPDPIIFATLTFLAFAAHRLLPAMQLIYSSVIAIGGGKVSMLDVLALMENNGAAIQPSPQMRRTGTITFKDRIRLSNVSFTYPEAPSPVFKNLSLDISKGEKLLIEGASGAGKTTLFDLMTGLLFPTTGSMHIDKTEVTQNNVGELQSLIAYIPQHPYFADASALENIAFGQKHHDENESKAQEVARQAQLHDFIAKLPDRYHSNIGEDGSKLSGGQKKRLAIARGLFKGAEIIFIDEGTSGLDKIRARAVTETVLNLPSDTTVIMIAHLSDMQHRFDRVMEVAEGKIVDTTGKT